MQKKMPVRFKLPSHHAVIYVLTRTLLLISKHCQNIERRSIMHSKGRLLINKELIGIDLLEEQITDQSAQKFTQLPLIHPTTLITGKS